MGVGLCAKSNCTFNLEHFNPIMGNSVHLGIFQNEHVFEMLSNTVPH